MSKKLNTLMAMMSVSLAMSGITNNDNLRGEVYDDGMPKLSDKEKKKRQDEYNKQKVAQGLIETQKSNGLKEFTYGEHTILALNQKNADKKAKKNGWI
jgi:hypothetical protein